MMIEAGMWPMLQDRPVMDAVRLRALWSGPAFAPIYVTCVCLGDRMQSFPPLGALEYGLVSVPCVTGDGRDWTNRTAHFK